MQRGRVVEHHLHIEVEQVRHAKVQPLLQRLLVRLEEVHRAVQVMQLQCPAPLDAHVLGEPLFVAVQLRRRRTGAIGDHGEQRALDGELELAVVEQLADELGQSDLSPQVFEHIDVAVGPGVDHAQRGVIGDELFG